MSAPAPFFVVGLGFVIDHFFWVCCALYGLVLLRRGWRYSAAAQSSDTSRVHRALSIVGRLAIRFVVVMGLWHGVFAGMDYSLERGARRSAYDCIRSWPGDDSNTWAPGEGGAYFAEECNVTGGGDGGVPEGYSLLLRLHSASTGEVLAEELVLNGSSLVIWHRDRVLMYGVDRHGTTGVSVPLPPPPKRSELSRFAGKLFAWPR